MENINPALDAVTVLPLSPQSHDKNVSPSALPDRNERIKAQQAARLDIFTSGLLDLAGLVAHQTQADTDTEPIGRGVHEVLVETLLQTVPAYPAPSPLNRRCSAFVLSNAMFPGVLPDIKNGRDVDPDDADSNADMAFRVAHTALRAIVADSFFQTPGTNGAVCVLYAAAIVAERLLQAG